ncbi:hypothetical protein OSB04_010327 [Centaurea solstitialis]|uniref:PB1 domain-containing protein n=1 Tax=Centaurea solstitialis TaxID=347529 RepID=A0AA38TS62_9ASTR|nr:hypothetical protein OSB04_010327 [Centaurea solstitialis]
MKRKCKDLDIEWQEKDHLKKNVNYLYESQSERNDEGKAALQGPLADNKEVCLDENTVTIKAECEEDMIKFTLPISSATFATIVEEIGKRFKLDPANFRLKYQDKDGDWILLTSDEDMKISSKIEIETTKLFQFWAPVKTTSGRWLLTTSGQPFAISEVIDDGQKYRSCSVRYRYSIDDVVEVEVEEDPTIIADGAPARAFLNRMPELVPDMRVHRTTPLESVAVRCGLFRSVMVPVFDPSGTCCVGVVECSSDHPYPIITMYDDLIEAFKTVSGLQHARDAILKALEIIWQKLRVDLVQVWIAYKDEDHVSFSSSLEDSPTKRMLGLKLLHYIGDDELYDDYVYTCFCDHSCICDIPLKMGEEGLVGRTLANSKPRFMRRLSKLSDNNEPLMILGHNYFDPVGGDPFECSCFVICLRNTETGDFNYVFEFLWQEVPDYVNLMESILLYMRRCLPNFKYASGGELGDELRIIDVDNSTKSKIECLTIFQGAESSSESEALEKRSSVGEGSLRALKAKCKTTPISLSQEGIIEAAKNLYGNNDLLFPVELVFT